jgi:hypothetical protein
LADRTFSRSPGYAAGDCFSAADPIFRSGSLDVIRNSDARVYVEQGSVTPNKRTGRLIKNAIGGNNGRGIVPR